MDVQQILETAVGQLDAVIFYAAAALALAAGVFMVVQRNTIHSAFALIVVMCCLSVVYGILGSPFIAVLQIAVYAGAIMVLFLFVIMLLNVRTESHPRGEGRSLKALAVGLVAVLVVQLAAVLLRAEFAPGPAGFEATARKVAAELFSLRFLYVFEATSILILAALVGAVALAKKDL
ncbi:MAG: NADH-quinone oxidoreductase subunit J [Vicinamibacteria bacterium]